MNRPPAPSSVPADDDPPPAPFQQQPEAAVPEVSAAAAGRRGWVAFLLLAGVAAAADLVSKRLIFDRLGMPGQRPGITLVPEILSLETNLNEGALFGMGQGLGLVFAGISLAAVAGIVALVARPATRRDPWLVVALSLITGGILGNLYDRMGLPGLRWHFPPERRGEAVLAVRDWIHFKLDGIIDWPIFNLADSWLVIGAGLLVALSLRAPTGTAADPEGDA